MDRDIARVRAATLPQSGQTVIALPPADLDLWRQRTAPVVADWPKNKPNGEKVLETFRALYAEADSGK